MIAGSNSARVDAARWEITANVPGPLGMLAEFWRYRRLTTFLAVRTLRRVYRRTVLGWVWLLIIPLLPVALRTLVFGGLIGVTSDGVPYFLFLMVGQLTWDFFATAFAWGSRGLELHGGVQDVYVPRIIMPVGAMANAFVDLAIKVVVLTATAAYFRLHNGHTYISGGPPIVVALAALALALLFAMSLAFFTSIWSVGARDTRFAIGQLLAIWFLVTPILYPMSEVPAAWRPWMLLNPMAAIVAAFKYGVLGIGQPPGPDLAIAAAIVAVLFVAGLTYFARHDAAANDAR